MNETLLLYAYLIPSVLIAGISKGGFGGGAAFAATLLVVGIMPPTEAVSLMLLVFIFMDQINLIVYWKKWDFSILKPLIGWSLAGLLLGWLTFDFFDAGVIKLFIITIVIAFWIVPLLPLHAISSRVPRSLGGIIAGGTAGFSSCIVNAGGPPIAAYLVRKTPSKEIFQGCSVFFFWWINLAKLPVFVSLGLYSYDNILLAFQMIPAALVGIAVGVFISKYISEKNFRYIIQALLVFAVLQIAYSSIVELSSY